MQCRLPWCSLLLQAALAQLVVKRFLLLAALLDRAVALPNLPGGAPLLFRAESKVKASAQVGAFSFLFVT